MICPLCPHWAKKWGGGRMPPSPPGSKAYVYLLSLGLTVTGGVEQGHYGIN